MVSELIEYYGLKVVQAYMNYIQKNAEVAVRDLLRIVGTRTLERTGKNVLTAQDYMDDGSSIQLTVSIDVESGSAIFDFRFVLLFITYVKLEKKSYSIHFIILVELDMKFGVIAMHLKLLHCQL